MPIGKTKSRPRKVFQQPAFTPPRATPPTQAQTHWLRANPAYQRTSHIGHLVKFRECGTLHPDGTFVPAQSGNPVLDGGGAFGVGIPVSPRRRR